MCDSVCRVRPLIWCGSDLLQGALPPHAACRPRHVFPFHSAGHVPGCPRRGPCLHCVAGVGLARQKHWVGCWLLLQAQQQQQPRHRSHEPRQRSAVKRRPRWRLVFLAPPEGLLLLQDSDSSIGQWFFLISLFPLSWSRGYIICQQFCARTSVSATLCACCHARDAQT